MYDSIKVAMLSYTQYYYHSISRCRDIGKWWSLLLLSIELTDSIMQKCGKMTFNRVVPSTLNSAHYNYYGSIEILYIRLYQHPEYRIPLLPTPIYAIDKILDIAQVK